MATSNTPATDSGTTLDSSGSSATADLYSAAMGPIGAAHYQKAFAKFEASERARPSWNWAAALITLNWMVFRRLWGPALIYVGAVIAAALLVFGIGRLVFQFPPEVEAGVLAAFGLFTIVVPGALGDRLAYKACQARVQDALAANATLPEACAMLKGQAVTRGRLIVQAVVNALLVAVAMAAYSALPSVDNLPMGSNRMADARNVAVGRATDLASLPTAPAASAPLAAPAASAPLAAASAPLAAASAPSKAQPVLPALPALAPSPNKAASAPTANKATSAAPPAKSQQATAQAEEVVAPAVKGRATAVVKPITEKASANATATTSSAPPQFVINVGLFADPNNALNAYTRLKDAALPVTTREVKTAKGMLSRIRVGPFETEAEAERAAEKIKELKLDAVIVKP